MKNLDPEIEFVQAEWMKWWNGLPWTVRWFGRRGLYFNTFMAGYYCPIRGFK